MAETDYRQAVLDLVRAADYRPLKPRQIAKRLRVAREEVEQIKRAVKQLIAEGLIAYGESHLVQLPGEEAKPRQSRRILGVFRRREGGHGFVRPARTTGATLEDIYIPADRAGDASSGDLVAVRVSSKQHGKHPGPRGEIVEIVERETHQFVGTYFEQRGMGLVQVDGTVFAQPIYVGDPGAKNAQPNDKVVLEIIRFPSHVRDGEGVITQVLGPRGQPGVDTQSIIYEFGLPGEFAQDAMEEAREQAERFEEVVPEGRRDLTADTIITIDPVDARDFDDAISLERLENGYWRLGVHIADVAHFVPAGSGLDREAYDRATSTYLPDRVIPMLPEVISNGLASLQPDRIRFAKTAYMEFTAEGIRTQTELANTAIKSSRRFSYEEVDDYLAHRDAWREKLDRKVFDLLGRMHELAMILRGRRRQRGALELTMPEVKVDLDRDGRVAGAHVVAHTESHQIIEEFMLAANEAVAEQLAGRKIPFLRRIHSDPDLRKLKLLTQFVEELGFKTESLESRFELQKLLDKVKGRPEEQAVNYALLRSLQRAAYSPLEEGHYALASQCYCHFTSPIRRYPDLTIHRLVDALVAHRKPKSDFDELVVVGEHCSDREQRAEAAERNLVKLKLLHYLSTRIGEEFDAIVTGVESYGLFAQGIELPAEGMIRIAALADDYYHFDRASHTLSGHRSGNTFRLGDPVRVAVARVDLERRELDLRIVGRQTKPRQTAKKKPSGDKPARPTRPGRPRRK